MKQRERAKSESCPLVPGVTTDDNHLTLVQENLQEFSKYGRVCL